MRAPTYGRLRGLHEELARAVAAGDSLRTIAARYGVDGSAVYYALKRKPAATLSPARVAALRRTSAANRALLASEARPLVLEMRASVRRTLATVNRLRAARGAPTLQRRQLAATVAPMAAAE